MFSQNQEEEEILEYFGDHVGTFLDIGCNDCKTFSNTHALALRGWSGVLIDPSPRAIEKCKALYEGRKDIFIYPWAISKQFKNNGTELLFESSSLLGKGDIGLVSTFHKHEMDRFKHVVQYEPVEVKTYKWKTAYNRLPIKKFDCISIDVESDELNILPDMDLTDTKVIILEWNSIPNTKLHFEKYLDGFKLLYTSAENVLYGR
jgi:FkbM family methyltransferase